MTYPQAAKDDENAEYGSFCRSSVTNISDSSFSSNHNEKGHVGVEQIRFDWNSNQIGTILGSFYWGKLKMSQKRPTNLFNFGECSFFQFFVENFLEKFQPQKRDIVYL